MGFQRARSQDQIQNRIQEIVQVASDLYDASGYEGLNFSKISEHTDFTRPNIYKYFKTKDEILLVILKDDFKAFTEALIESFKERRDYSLNEVSEIWTNRLLEHKRLLDIYGLLFAVIEKNVSLEALTAYKREMLVLQTPLVNLVSQLFPRATIDSIKEFINIQIILALGLYPMCTLSEIQINAVKQSGIEYTPPEFKSVYSSSIYKMLYCLEHSIEQQ